MKILTCNAGYFLGFEKPLPNYLLDLKRSCMGDRNTEERCIDALAEIVDSESPDLVALQEVDQGSIRTRTSGQAGRLEKKLEDGYSVASQSKYGPGKLMSRLPLLRKMSNAVLSNGGEVEEHYVSPGSKQLLMEYRSSGKGLSVFTAHLPTLHRFRRNQLEKVREKVLERDEAILCGDFNCYHGKEELEKIFDGTRYQVHSPGPTHPRSEPFRELNLFIAPESLDVEVRKIDTDISDHLPVVAETKGL